MKKLETLFSRQKFKFFNCLFISNKTSTTTYLYFSITLMCYTLSIDEDFIYENVVILNFSSKHP